MALITPNMVFYVEKLDAGFIFQQNGFKRAVPNREALTTLIIDMLKNKLDNLSNDSRIKDFCIEIEIQTNLPKSA